jgi:ribonuclease D
MTRYELPPVEYIRQSHELAQLVDSLRHDTLIALDTESNSLYAYQEQVCLIQLSTRQQDYLIDAISVDDLSPLGQLTADPAIEIIFHAAEYDLMCLKRDYDFEVTGIFDTMFGARILGVENFGLANLLEAHFGVKVDKRFQRADWSKRPLSPEQQRYAQMDTHFLPRLRDIIAEQLAENNALEEAIEIFDELARTEAHTNEFDPEGYWRINGARRLNPQQMAGLREVYLWRETIAKQEDQPPFKIMNNEQMLKLVTQNIRSLHDLNNAKSLRHRYIRVYGRELLDALRRGRDATPPKRPRRQPSVDPETIDRHDQLKQWRKERAQQRGVESDIIVPRETLWRIARESPRTVEELQTLSNLGPWRAEQYGEEILQVLAGDLPGY